MVVPVQVAACRVVGPDVLVDGLVADVEDAITPKPAGDLLRAPLR